jgi:hypothetical protein
MTATTAPRQCAYPGCDQLPAAPSSDRGAKPKYCDDPDHNPLSAHRERRRRDAAASGQRTEETGGQPVTLGITRAAELINALDRLTAQHADTLASAITELRAVGDIESAEAEVYAARTSADQRVATAEARLAEEIQRRRDAEADRDDARADREQSDDAAAQAITRMNDLERQLAELRAATEQEVRSIRASAHRRHQCPHRRPGGNPRRTAHPRRASRNRPRRRPHRKPAPCRTAHPRRRSRSRPSADRRPHPHAPVGQAAPRRRQPRPEEQKPPRQRGRSREWSACTSRGSETSRSPTRFVHGFVHETRRDGPRRGETPKPDVDPRRASAEVSTATGDRTGQQRRPSYCS